MKSKLLHVFYGHASLRLWKILYLRCFITLKSPMRGLGVQMSMARTLLLFLPKQRPFIYTAIFEWDAYFPIISFHWFFVTHNIIRTNCQRYQFLSLFNPSKLPSHPSGCVRVAGSGPRYKYAAPHFVYLNHYRMLSSQHRNTGLPFGASRKTNALEHDENSLGAVCFSD